VTLPALSAAVYRAAAPIPQSPSAPAIAVDPLPGGGEARGRAEVLAEVSGNSFYDVTFHAKVGDEAWQQIGTDDNRRYRVFHDIADVPPGTTIQYRAAVLDNAGHTRASDISSVQVAAPLIAMTAPADGGNVRGEVTLRAEATPDQNHYSVTFERNVDENGWTAVGTDASQGAYSVVDDISDVANEMPISYRAVLTYATGQTVTSAERSVTVKPPVTTAVVHYRRAGASPDYSNWGLHFWGDATADTSEPSWDAPRAPDGFDTYGAYFEIPITNDLARLFFVVHKPNGETVPTDREPGGDRSIVPFDNPEIWLKQGDATIYFSEPTP
jgi:hypothetical protein